MSITITDDSLYEHSLQVILENQAPTGAFLACPTMPDYQFSWFRDGAYIAYALTQDGLAISATHKGSMAAQWESAARFHNWCAAIISARREKLERTIERARRGEPPEISDTLHARYHADGTEGPDGWPEFQLDGPGTWLWSLKEYTDRAGVRPLPAAWERAVVLVADYLAALWRTPCYDCWEERGTDIHISTLGAIYAGLKAAQALAPECDFEQTLQAIRTFVLEHGLTPGGELAKSVGLDMVDASLLSVAVPHGMLNVDDPIMRRTVARIERELLARRGGVHRHLQDTYYGGGAWVLLALWLGWYYIELGETGRAKHLVEWAKKQTDPAGNLPEQVDSAMLHPSFHDDWVAQRGPIANPLLWTHANYLIVRRHLEA